MGLVTTRPEDPVQYLVDSLSQISSNGWQQVTWDTFLPRYDIRQLQPIENNIRQLGPVNNKIKQLEPIKATTKQPEAIPTITDKLKAINATTHPLEPIINETDKLLLNANHHNDLHHPNKDTVEDLFLSAIEVDQYDDSHLNRPKQKKSKNGRRGKVNKNDGCDQIADNFIQTQSSVITDVSRNYETIEDREESIDNDLGQTDSEEGNDGWDDQG